MGTKKGKQEAKTESVFGHIPRLGDPDDAPKIETACCECGETTHGCISCPVFGAARRSGKVAERNKPAPPVAMKDPSLSLCVKLGSIAIHAEEMMGSDGHVFDRAVLEALLGDPEVRAWLDDPGHAVFFPVKRSKKAGG